MTHPEDQPARPSTAGAATDGNDAAAWRWRSLIGGARRLPVQATYFILAMLAVWPALALIGAVRSREFSFALPALIAAFSAIVLLALALIATQPSERRANLTLAAIASFGTFFAGDLLLGWKQKSLRSIAETVLVRPAARHESPARGLLSSSHPDLLPPVDRRTEADMRKVLSHYNQHPPRIANISQLLPAIDAGHLPRFLPLSWPSGSLLFSCNEGDQRQNPILRTDRYGLNNEDWVYLWEREKVMLVGDSFAAGFCVHQEQSVQGVMRRSGLAAYSAGIGGNGPLMSLAAITEYGRPLGPRSVFWLYFDGNDILDLRDRELKSAFLLQYLADPFTQRLVERQGDVDRYWHAFAEQGWTNLAQIQEKLRAEAPDGVRQEQAARANLQAVRRDLALPDLGSLTADADVLRVFKAILATAERRVRAWGGDLYFVMIPNQDDFHGKVPPYRRAVLDAVDALGIPVIDLDRPLRASGDPLQFYPLREAWGHFNPEGYKLFAYSLIDALVAHRRASGDPVAVEEIDAKYKRLARVNALINALRAVDPDASPVALLRLKPGRSVQTHTHDYPHYVTVTKVLEDDGRATSESGSAMYGGTFQATAPGGFLRVRVRANGYSEQDNRVVVALFMDGEKKPRAVTGKPIKAKSTSQVELEYEVLMKDVSPHAISIRIGPAMPGSVIINGNAAGPSTGHPKAYIELAEISVLSE